MNFSTERGDCLWWLMVFSGYKFRPSRPERSEFPRLEIGRVQDSPRSACPPEAWALGHNRCQRVGRAGNREVFADVRENASYRDDHRLAVKCDPDCRMVCGTEGNDAIVPVAGTDIAPPRCTWAGTGQPWATISSLAAIPLTESLWSGYKIKKDHDRGRTEGTRNLDQGRPRAGETGN